MSLQRVPINNFRGGLNTRDGAFELQPNESPDLLNVTISSLVGQLEVRKGKERLDVSGMPPTEAPDNMKQCILGSAAREEHRWLMLSVNGKIYSASPTGVVTLRHTGTEGTTWAFETFADAAFHDHVWCVNGTDLPQKWDGVSPETENWTATKGTLPNGKVIRVWENRLLVANTNEFPERVFFSEYGDPEATVKEYGFLDLRGTEDDLDEIQELYVLAARCYVFRRRDVSAIFNPVTFVNRRIGQPGCWGRFQVAEFENKLFYFNQQGLWETAGVAVTQASGQINNYFPEKLSLTHLDKVRLIFTKDAYPRLLLTIPIEGSASNNILLEMVPNINFRRIGGRRYLLLPAFMLHTFVASSLAMWNPTGALELITAGSVGKISRLYHGTTDEGVPIEAHWKSSWMAIQAMEPKERVRRLNVDLYGDAFADVFVDFETSPRFSAQLPALPETETDASWDGGIWDTGIWDAAPGEYRFARVRPETRGRYHQVQFRTVPGGVPFLVNSAELAIRGGKEH